MFGQLISTRLRAAEKALRNGRIDEAYRLTANTDLGQQRRGASVLKSLTELFVERAREHYREDRFDEALVDLDKAEVGGTMHEEIAELRRQVEVVAAEVSRKDQSRRRRVDAAKKRLDRGSLAAGQMILDQASQRDREAVQLRRDADERSQDVTEMLSQFDHLLRKGQHAAAAQRVHRAKLIEAHSERTTAAEKKLCDAVVEQARTSVVHGRLKRAADELACLGSLGDALPTKREVADLIAAASEAAGAVAANRFADARRRVMGLSRLLSGVKWVKEAIGHLGRIEESRTALCAGPLGENMDDTELTLPQAPTKKAAPPSPDDTLPIPGRGDSANGELPQRLLLLVDGGGSYLILRGDRTTIGRAACDKPADVPIFSDIAERHANIAHVDDDYFLYCTREAEIDGRIIKHKLLRDGDRVVMGQKAKFTFRLPSRKSATAALDLSDTTKMPQDVRRVILFDSHATIGAGSTAHIQCRHATPPLILFERDGAMWIRQKNDGHLPPGSTKLDIGKQMEIGGVSLVLESWRPRTPGMGTA